MNPTSEITSRSFAGVSSTLATSNARAANEIALRAWEAFRATTHFRSLDGLRSLSILAVIWHHGPGFHMEGLGGSGYMGVPLFFAISGFLITTLLLREHERTGVISLPRFYARRSLRIFPLYFAVLGLYCILVYVARSDRTFFANVPYFLTYTSNWFVGSSGTFAFAWSLAAEEQFYGTWPSAVRYLRPARAAWLMAALVVVLVVWRSFISEETSRGNFGLVILHSVPMAICWGCALAFLLQSRSGFALLWKIVGYRWAPAVLLCVIAATFALFTKNDVWTHFLLAGLVASCVVREDHILAPALNWRWVAHMGSVSYGMYLTHGLVYNALDVMQSHIFPSWNAHSVGGFFLALAITTGLATVIFRYYETPFLRMKSRFGA